VKTAMVHAIQLNLVLIFYYFLIEKVLLKSFDLSGRVLNNMFLSINSGVVSRLFERYLIQLFLFVLGLFVLLFSLVWLIYFFRNTSYLNQTIVYLIFTTLPASIIILVAVYRSRSGYNAYSQAYHSFFLENDEIGKYLLKKYIQPGSMKASKLNAIIVTGMARSGTSALTRWIYDISKGTLASLTYRQMPLLAYPSRFRYSFLKGRFRNRSHNDGLKIGLDTVEAFDEYVFKLLIKTSLTSGGSLPPYNVGKDNWKTYLNYVNRFSRDNNAYLSKNNNFILRLKDFQRYQLEGMKVVVLVRRPEEVAFSLLKQHLLHCELHRKDKFALDYMNWIGHHEFGLGHKPFEFPAALKLENYPKTDPNYWLCRWIEYHYYLLENIQIENIILVMYDDFITDPVKALRHLGDYLEFPNSNEIDPFKKTEYDFSDKLDATLLEVAMDIYERVDELCAVSPKEILKT
jgi:hypothetical protein